MESMENNFKQKHWLSSANISYLKRILSLIFYF